MIGRDDYVGGCNGSKRSNDSLVSVIVSVDVKDNQIGIEFANIPLGGALQPLRGKARYGHVANIETHIGISIRKIVDHLVGPLPAGDGLAVEKDLQNSRV